MIPCQTINSTEQEVFIAGNRQSMEFECVYEDGTPIDLTSSTAKILVSPYGNPSVTTISKDGLVFGVNKFIVTFEEADTINLRGLYSFQALITDIFGKTFRPLQGSLLIQEAIKTT